MFRVDQLHHNPEKAGGGAMSALPGFCACGQRLPIGGWPHATCWRCAGGIPAVALVEQARNNANFWRGELAAGRLTFDAKTFASLLRDLEMAGGVVLPADGQG